MKNNNVFEWFGCGAGTILTALQTQEVFQIISLILTCIATLLTISFTLYKWYKNAIKDKIIDDTEAQEGIDIINDSIKKIEDLKNKKKEKK